MTMRKSYLFVLAALIAVSAYSQKKPKINAANSAREKGELAEAKAIIDEAIVHEKTKDDAKTWYYRGLIYATIDTTSNADIAALSDNAMEEAVKAFDKAHELDPDEKGLYVTGNMGIPTLMSQQISEYYSFYYNKGVEGFQNEEFQTAVDNFISASMVMPEDTNAIVNAAYAAHNGELFEQAVELYGTAIDKGASSTDLYYNQINIMISGLKDNEGALALIDEALKVLPNDPNLSKQRISLLIQLEKVDEAKADLTKAIENEPDNAALYFSLGILLGETEDFEGAKNAYVKAVEIDPDHYGANFNLGVELINEAQDVIKEVNNLGMSKADQKKARDMQPVIKDKLKAALPQWERIYELKPEDTTTIETLAYIYNNLDMKEKFNEMSEKLN